MISRSSFAAIAAWVSLANAVPVLVAPAAILSIYGVTPDPQDMLLAQLPAASYVGYAIINWSSRGTTDVAARSGLDAGNAVAWAISAILWLYAASSGITNPAGWFGVGLTVLFTIGWTYFLLADRRIGTRIAATAEPR